ncbi:MAG: class I SAM-dependent methyltransferase [Verrucomicrobiaceae bacterium]|nr:MAG: class I SAM-dependent methyltransferase [Verrucomicrobiaceae bacterium]
MEAKPDSEMEGRSCLISHTPLFRVCELPTSSHGPTDGDAPELPKIFDVMSQFLLKYNYIYESVMADMAKAGVPLRDFLAEGSRILEYGAGTGESAYRFAREFGNCEVHGVDLHNAFEGVFEAAIRELGDTDRPGNLHFGQMGASQSTIAIANDEASTIDRSYLAQHKFNFCFSWCVFEHVDITIISATMSDIYDSLVPGGLLHLKINPLFFSLRGSHLHSIVPEPWAHLIYDHQTLKKKVYADAARGMPVDMMWHQYETLNRITADDLKRYAEQAGFEIIYQQRQREGKPSAALASAYCMEALLVKDIVLVCRK